MRTPVAGEVRVHDRRFYVESGPGGARPDLSEAFAGQNAGLAGAAVPGVILLYTGLYAGEVGLVAEVHDEAPALGPDWEDIVEVSFRPASDRTRLVRWDGSAVGDLGLTPADYRVRYCARGMDDGADRYLLQFWPAPPARDRVIRQTSDTAQSMHDYARATPRTAEQRAEARRRTRELFARAAEERAERADRARRLHYEEWEWGGRLPSGRLRDVQGSNVLGLLRFDSDLVHALDVVGPEVQRAVALLSARRACEAAGLTGVPWVAHALTELDAGRPLPPPFDDLTLMWATLRADPRVPDTSVLGAIPPERPPYVPPPSGDTGGTHVETVHLAVPPRTPGRIAQPFFALPAVVAAAGPDPLAAALDAVWHAVNTCGEHYPRLLAEVRAVCAERRGSIDAVLRVRTTPPRPADVTAIVPQLASLARRATRLHPRPGSPTAHDSSVGGPLLWPADEPWPHCDGPHLWDQVNEPVSPDGIRRQRLRRAAEAGGTYHAGSSPAPEDKAAVGRTKPAHQWPEGPVPLLPVAQLYLRDVPLLRPPGQATADLLQVLWCPFDHPAEPRTALYWRSAADVAKVLDTPPEPPVIQFPGYLPEPCLLAPEEITEYPHVMELDEGVRRQVEDRRNWQAAGAVADGADMPYAKEHYRASYRESLSVAPGWKVGGWTRWGLTDPMPRLCSSCGSAMEPLLTIASTEWDGDEESWIPREERDRALTDTGSALSEPTMLNLAGGYNLQLHVCPVSADHPHLQLVQ